MSNSDGLWPSAVGQGTWCTVSHIPSSFSPLRSSARLRQFPLGGERAFSVRKSYAFSSMKWGAHLGFLPHLHLLGAHWSMGMQLQSPPSWSPYWFSRVSGTAGFAVWLSQGTLGHGLHPADWSVLPLLLGFYSWPPKPQVYPAAPLPSLGAPTWCVEQTFLQSFISKEGQLTKIKKNLYISDLLIISFQSWESINHWNQIIRNYIHMCAPRHCTEP